MIFKPNEDAVSKYNHMNRDGSVNVQRLIESDNFQRQLEGFRGMFKRQTILALWQGKRPPNQVGGYGILTKKKLIVEWNDDWQKEMDELEEYYEISYNILFGIPDEHPNAGIVYTADEIAERYGREEENS
jgi:hypothetical protein